MNRSPKQNVMREQKSLSPVLAIREGLANALVHRDLHKGGGTISFVIYDDRLEIRNPGSLDFGLDPEKLCVHHESRPGNPLVAQAFYLAGVIEKWGTGTLRMIDVCRESHNPLPVWTDSGQSVVANVGAYQRPESRPDSRPETRDLEDRILRALSSQELSKSQCSNKRQRGKDRAWVQEGPDSALSRARPH